MGSIQVPALTFTLYLLLSWTCILDWIYHLHLIVCLFFSREKNTYGMHVYLLRLMFIYNLRFYIHPSRAEAHLNDVRFNSNWVFFTNNDFWRWIFNFRSFWKFPNLALLKALYSILKTASWVRSKKDNMGKYLRWVEKIPKKFSA